FLAVAMIEIQCAERDVVRRLASPGITGRCFRKKIGKQFSRSAVIFVNDHFGALLEQSFRPGLRKLILASCGAGKQKTKDTGNEDSHSRFFDFKTARTMIYCKRRSKCNGIGGKSMGRPRSTVDSPR